MNVHTTQSDLSLSYNSPQEETAFLSYVSPCRSLLPVVALSNEANANFSFNVPFEDPSMEPLPLPPMIPIDEHQKRPIEISRSRGLLLPPLLKHDSDSPATQDHAITFTNNNKRSVDSLVPEGNNTSSYHSQKMQSPNGCTDSLFKEDDISRFRPSQEMKWRTQFNKLVDFKQQNGHCCVPCPYPEDPILARWVKRQRYQYKKLNENNPALSTSSTMTARSIDKLEAIGFVWQYNQDIWREKLNELKHFLKENGHCNVPSYYPKNQKLSTWVTCQRRQFKYFVSGKPSSMTTDRCEALCRVGFVFQRRKRS